MPTSDKVGEPSTLPEPTREEKSAAWNWLKQYALSGIGDARQAYVALWEWTELKKASTASAELRCVDMIGCRQGQPCLQERFAASSEQQGILELAESMANKQQINGWFEKVAQILGREVVRLSDVSATRSMEATQAMVDAVNARPDWSGFTVDDLQELLDAIASTEQTTKEKP